MRQTLTAEEAQAVVRLQLEGSGDPSRVRVEDLAEALSISPDEVEKILDRARRGHAEAVQREMEGHRKRDMRRLALAFVFSVVLAGGAFSFYRYRESRREIMDRTEIPSAAIAADANDLAESAIQHAKKALEEDMRSTTPAMPAPAPPEAVVAPNINPTKMTVSLGDAAKTISMKGRSMEQVAGEMEAWAASQRKSSPRDANSDAATLHALDVQDYADPGLAQASVQFGDEPMERVFPIYTGSNPDVEVKAAAERWRILGEAMHIEAQYPAQRPADAAVKR